MKNDNVSPIASRIIEKCGGHRAVAALTGRSLEQVYRWTYSKAKGGTGGTIPAAVQERLVAAARSGAVPLVATDFIDLPDLSNSSADGASAEDAEGCPSSSSLGVALSPDTNASDR